MAYKLIQKFISELGEHESEVLVGPFSPLLLVLPWSTDPEISLGFIWINRGRSSVIVLDHYFYHLIAEKKFRKCIQGKISIQDLERAYTDYADKTRAFYDRATQIDFAHAAEKTILDCLRETIMTFEPVEQTVYIETFNYDMALRVIGGEKRSRLDRRWKEATNPTFISFEGRRLNEVVKLIKESTDLSLIVPKVKYIYTDYYWTKSDTQILHALKEIQTHLSEKEAGLKTIFQEATKRKSVYDTWCASLTQEEKLIADYIQMVMRLRDLRKDPIAEAQVILVLIATELLTRAGIDPKYGNALTMYDYRGGIAYLKENKGYILKRAKGSICKMGADAMIEVELCDYDKAVEEFYVLTSKASKEAVHEIKGQIASKGKATGAARIVLDPHNDKGFTQGDILVTSMTRPEFVPLMKMAGAVVTNEGGITCHAAIVSREIGIPCVIGTKIATRVLKDGDMVEVDAEKGIVKILKSSK